MGRQRTPRRRPPERASGALSGAAALGLLLTLALQLWMCRDVWTRPFLDTRLHYDYDNADYAFRARSGLRNGDLRSQFGVTLNRYARWGERRGEPAYYTDHPFLAKALYQQFTRAAGTGEAASRAFALGLAFAVAAGLFVVVRQSTGRVLPATAAAATLVSLPLFATYQTCIKFEMDGMAAGVWLFASWNAYGAHPTPRRRALYAAMVAVCMLTHWTSALLVAALVLSLADAALRRRRPRARSELAATVLAAGAGLAALLAAMAYLQRGWASAFAVLARAAAIRAAPIAPSVWWERQALYARQNFTSALPWVVLVLGAVILARSRRASAGEDAPADGGRPSLSLFLFATLGVGVAWVVAFPQGSFIHIYWQLWLCLPIAALAGAFVAAFPPGSAAERISALTVGAAVVALLAASRATYAGIFRSQLGTPEDVAFLASLREDRFDRFVFVPLTDVALNSWFTGPLFEYYTDRPAAIATAPDDVHVGDKLFVVRYTAREDVARRVAEWSGRRLENEKCSTRFCAYDVLTGGTADR